MIRCLFPLGGSLSHEALDRLHGRGPGSCFHDRSAERPRAAEVRIRAVLGAVSSTGPGCGERSPGNVRRCSDVDLRGGPGCGLPVHGRGGRQDRTARACRDDRDRREGKGRVLVAEQERRSRLGKVLDALLHTPGVTARGTADLLGITHQTATSYLRVLRAAGLVKEVTGRESFRAFSLKI